MVHLGLKIILLGIGIIALYSCSTRSCIIAFIIKKCYDLASY